MLPTGPQTQNPTPRAHPSRSPRQNPRTELHPLRAPLPLLKRPLDGRQLTETSRFEQRGTVETERTMDHQILPSPQTFTVPFTRRTSPSPDRFQCAPPMRPSTWIVGNRLESKWMVGNCLYLDVSDGEKPEMCSVRGTTIDASSMGSFLKPWV